MHACHILHHPYRKGTARLRPGFGMMPFRAVQDQSMQASACLDAETAPETKVFLLLFLQKKKTLVFRH
jgi:hypothetical protein